MVIVIGFFLLTISILLFFIGRTLRRINQTLDSGKRQLEDYLKVILETASEEDTDYIVGNEEKQMLWTTEEKEQIFNEMLQEIFQ